MSLAKIIIYVVICIGVSIELVRAGFQLGSTTRNLRERLEELEIDYKERQTDNESVSSVVDVSPRAMNKRQHTIKSLEDEDRSQIVRAKSPQQMRADKDRREREALDKITNAGIR